MDRPSLSTPSPSRNSTPSSRERAGSDTRRANSNQIYALQVRAFIEAAEVVDADPDTIEDILEGFEGDVHFLDEDDDDDRDDGNDNDELNANVSLARATAEQAKVGAGPDSDGDPEFDAFMEEASSAWSRQEVKSMTNDLKEHGMSYFINLYAIRKAIPIPKLLYAFDICLCPQLRQKRPKTLMYFLQVALSRELQCREKLPMYNTIDDAVHLIQSARSILILTGAGISVSCGIPDFRSRNGLYASLQERGQYDLDDPQQMFDINYFREYPYVFYSFASQIYPSNFIPSPCHRFIRLIEDKGKLLRNYTQNIDTLETRAGVKRVLQCHGSFATASCIQCRTRVPGYAIEAEILNQRIPYCKACSVQPPPANKPKKKTKKKKSSSVWDEKDESDDPDFQPGIMKPDITFFGEKLTDDFDKALVEDRPHVDLILVVGTSLKVSPVSELLTHLRHSVPQILINKTPVKHINPDIVLLGNADDIVQHLCRRLGWDLPDETSPTSQTLDVKHPRVQKRASEELHGQEPQRVADSHVWLFEGAEGGKWVEEIEKRARSVQAQEIATDLSAGARSAGSPTSPTYMPQAKRARTK